MFSPKRILKNICGQYNKAGFSMIESVIALSVATITVMGAYSLTIAIERQYKVSVVTSDMYSKSRIAIERIFKDISETSNETITITDNAISFASARDDNGDFMLREYNRVLKSHRPDWQKAIIYYIFDDGNGRKLYRKEIPKTDWSANYDPDQAIDSDGEVVARDIVSMNFDYSPADSLVRAHILQVSLIFSKTRDEIESGPLPGVTLTTRVPIMNRR